MIEYRIRDTSTMLKLFYVIFMNLHRAPYMIPRMRAEADHPQGTETRKSWRGTSSSVCCTDQSEGKTHHHRFYGKCRSSFTFNIPIYGQQRNTASTGRAFRGKKLLVLYPSGTGASSGDERTSCRVRHFWKAGADL